MEIGLEDEIIDGTHRPKTIGRGNVIESSLSGIIKIYIIGPDNQLK